MRSGLRSSQANTPVSDQASKSQYLRARTLALENREPRPQLARDENQFKAIPAGPTREELENAIRAVSEVPDSLVTERGDAQVFIINRATYDKYAKASHPKGFDTILDEIGRLRETTFREVGEGTGEARDTDAYDEYYSHLFVWNKQKGELIGAYRLGLTDQIVPIKGIRGMYTDTQFSYDERLLDRLGPSIELGRSFVRSEYQGSMSGLPLLFQGIATFAGKNPHYRHLFGSVSISNEYSDLSKQLMLDYLKQHHSSPELSALVSSRHPPKLNPGMSPSETQTLISPVPGVKQLGKLVSQFEPDGKGAPVLLRRYSDWFAKFLTFDFDKDFNTVDGFIVVDMAEAGRLNRKQMDATMGKELAEKFMQYHEQEH